MPHEHGKKVLFYSLLQFALLYRIRTDVNTTKKKRKEKKKSRLDHCLERQLMSLIHKQLYEVYQFIITIMMILLLQLYKNGN